MIESDAGDARAPQPRVHVVGGSLSRASAALVHGAPHGFAASLCIGLGAANTVRAPWGVLFAAGGAAIVAAGTLARARVALALIALLLAGWWWGSVRLERLDRSVLVHHVGRVAKLHAVVTGPARHGRFAVRVPADVRRIGTAVLDEPVLLALPPGRAPPQGALVVVVGKVERPRVAEGGFDERAWLRRRGVHVIVDGSRWWAVGQRGGLAGAGDRLRAALADNVARGLGGERRAVISGIVLGDDESLSDELRDAFRASGLYHLLAVSGQNVGFLVAGVLLAAWLLGIPRWAAELAALAAILGYVTAVGWQPSVVRAGVAGSLASLAWLASRPRDRWYFLLAGAVVLLAWNPATLLEPGFQLSFAAVGAIFVVVPRLARELAGYPVPRLVGDVVAVSAACGVVTAPIVWFHFGAVPVYSVVSNALAAPVVAPLLGLGLLAGAVAPVAPSIAVALAWLNGWLAAYLAACARAVAALPSAQVESALVVGAVVALAVVAAVAPAGYRVRTAAAVAGMIVVAAFAWTLRPGTSPRPAPEGFRMTVLDVGQGDATLLEAPGAAVLVDQGPPEANVDRQLSDLGIERLDVVLLTHPSRDNIGGADAVLQRFDVGLVVEPSLPFDDPYGDPALVTARRRGIRVVVARAGQELRLGSLRLRVLWPDGSAQAGDDPNDHATVVLASYGTVDALLPADAESNVTLPLKPPVVEILKVAHHGSADPSLPQLLRLVRPQIAVISVGRENEYGHPAPSTVAALDEAANVSTYRTDLHGRLTIESDGARLVVRAER